MARMPSPDAHWRDSARPARFFFVDYRAAFPLVFCLLHIRLWSIGLAVGTVLFLATLERYGFTLVVFGRWLRAFMAGSHRMSQPWWKQ